MNCDPLARWYRWMEYLGMGRSLERRRSEFLAEAKDATQVLILGEGDGRFLCSFLSVNSTAQVDCVDSSREMLAVAERRVASRFGGERGNPQRVNFYRADARSWMPPPGRSYDLIVTHFFLDCFGEEELRAMILRFSASVSKDGCWIVSDFHQPTRGWRAWRARLWIRGLYLLFGWTTGLRVRRLPEYRPLLAQAGFHLTRQVTADAGLLISELWKRREPAATPTRELSASSDAKQGKAKG